jgi:hypothetical protein
MAVEGALDRVPGKGIAIDAYVSLVGIDLVSVEARIVVAPMQTYLEYAEAIGMTGAASRPLISAPQADYDLVVRENAELGRRLEERR